MEKLENTYYILNVINFSQTPHNTPGANQTSNLRRKEVAPDPVSLLENAWEVLSFFDENFYSRRMLIGMLFIGSGRW